MLTTTAFPNVHAGIVGPQTTILTVLDGSSNEGIYNLTTVVVDDLAPVLTYTSSYVTVSQGLGLALEHVEASATEGYVAGSFAVVDQPSGQSMNASVVAGEAEVDRCKLAGWWWLVIRVAHSLLYSRPWQCQHHLHGHGRGQQPSQLHPHHHGGRHPSACAAVPLQLQPDNHHCHACP